MRVVETILCIVGLMVLMFCLIQAVAWIAGTLICYWMDCHGEAYGWGNLPLLKYIKMKLKQENEGRE